MADKKIAMEYRVVQNKIADSIGFGKWYAQPVVKDVLNLKGFAKHLHDHNGTFKTSVIKGVLEELVECLVEMMTQGVGVKLDGLGTFRPTFECESTVSADDFDINTHLKGIHIRLIPENTKDEELTSRKFMSKVLLRKRDEPVATPVETEGGEG